MKTIQMGNGSVIHIKSDDDGCKWVGLDHVVFGVDWEQVPNNVFNSLLNYHKSKLKLNKEENN